jgi:hypothetical protein
MLLFGLTLISSSALACDPFPFEGTYMQNKVCHGDSRDLEPMKVKIATQEISYAGGVCSIDDKRPDGNTLAVRVTCKFKSGSVLSDTIMFTVKDDKSLAMAQKSGSYTATLNRCPG